MANPITPLKLKLLLGFNLVFVAILGISLLNVLKTTEKEYLKPIKTNAKEQNDQRPRDVSTAPAATPQNASGQDTGQAQKLEETKPNEEKKNETENPQKEPVDSGVTFYSIVLLMLISGALGGVLCNLRGFFMHYRADDIGFPANLEIPYYVRPFMGAGAGLFIYFVANFLITSITVQYLATNVPFQGMVSYVALSMLAGFGSLEFFQRLKETALTLFGQKAEKDRWQKLEDLYTMFKKGVLTEAEYNNEKTELLKSFSDAELSNLRMNATQNK
ncbi:MAG: SHOCT domain-containing protein [Saprospiraceae bacterium]|nr:SHOCT domain-containing protein [Saprospiraceae bacterium]